MLVWQKPLSLGPSHSQSLIEGSGMAGFLVTQSGNTPAYPCSSLIFLLLPLVHTQYLLYLCSSCSFLKQRLWGDCIVSPAPILTPVLLSAPGYLDSHL